MLPQIGYYLDKCDTVFYCIRSNGFQNLSSRPTSSSVINSKKGSHLFPALAIMMMMMMMMVMMMTMIIIIIIINNLKKIH